MHCNEPFCALHFEKTVCYKAMSTIFFWGERVVGLVSVARLLACPVYMRMAWMSGTFFWAEFFPLLLIKKDIVVTCWQCTCTLNADKLPPGGLHRKSVIK